MRKNSYLDLEFYLEGVDLADFFPLFLLLSEISSFGIIFEVFNILLDFPDLLLFLDFYFFDFSEPMLFADIDLDLERFTDFDWSEINDLSLLLELLEFSL